ncbi:unnamed protein product, partial [Rotaria sp. Silwood2]
SHDHHKLKQVRWSSRFRPNEYREVNEIAGISFERLCDCLCLQSIIIEQIVAKFMRQLLNELNYLHYSKILHLDIQPENILIKIEHDQIKLLFE